MLKLLERYVGPRPLATEADLRRYAALAVLASVVMFAFAALSIVGGYLNATVQPDAREFKDVMLAVAPLAVVPPLLMLGVTAIEMRNRALYHLRQRTDRFETVLAPFARR